MVDTNVFINEIFKGDTYCKAIFTLKILNKVSFVMNKEMQDELLITLGDILIEIPITSLRLNKLKDFNSIVSIKEIVHCLLWHKEPLQ